MKRTNPFLTLPKGKGTAHSGFTLIELLVVVAIIALLSATILASLASARNKAKDAKIQSELQSIQAQMELYSDSNGFSYNPGNAAAANTSCGSGAFSASSDATTNGAATLIAGIDNDEGENPPSTYPKMLCGADQNTWAVAAQLSTGYWWCVDSNGKSVQEPSAASGVTPPTSGSPFSGGIGAGPFACP